MTNQFTQPSIKKIIIAISGASGAIYGIKLLQKINKIPGLESHLILSKTASLTIGIETPYNLDEVIALSHHYHHYNNLAASLASGSFINHGMIVAPCSMKTLAEIALGLSNNLISRAADVNLKERRKLILMTRETPLNLSHLHNMIRVTEMGGIIAPPVPAFYNKPETLEGMIDYTVTRVLDLLGLHQEDNRRWGGI